MNGSSDLPYMTSAPKPTARCAPPALVLRPAPQPTCTGPRRAAVRAILKWGAALSCLHGSHSHAAPGKCGTASTCTTYSPTSREATHASVTSLLQHPQELSMDGRGLAGVWRLGRLAILQGGVWNLRHSPAQTIGGGGRRFIGGTGCRERRSALPAC